MQKFLFFGRKDGINNNKLCWHIYVLRGCTWGSSKLLRVRRRKVDFLKVYKSWVACMVLFFKRNIVFMSQEHMELCSFIVLKIIIFHMLLLTSHNDRDVKQSYVCHLGMKISSSFLWIGYHVFNIYLSYCSNDFFSSFFLGKNVYLGCSVFSSLQVTNFFITQKYFF